MSTRLLRVADWEKLAAEARYEPEVIASRSGVSLGQLERLFLHQELEPSPAVWARKQPPGVAGWRLRYKDRWRLFWKKYLKETVVVDRITSMRGF
jgi:hypothetical protein